MIDAGIQQPWPAAVRDAVTRFRQGDLVARPPIFYAADSTHAVWALTRATGSPSAGAEIFELDSADSPPYGLITTQTCDIFEETPKPKQPWIQLAPVYDAFTQLTGDQQRMVMQDRVVHLVHLTGPSLPAGFWVADLRIELPVETGTVQLIIVIKEHADTRETEEFFAAWWTSTSALVAKAQLGLLPNRVTTLRAMPALDYVDSFPLDFSYLSPDE